MKETLPQLIMKRFKINWRNGHQGFVNSQAIQDVMHSMTGRKHETVGRALRILAEEGKIEKKLMKPEGHKVESVYYKYIPTEHEQLAMFMGNYNKK